MKQKFLRKTALAAALGLMLVCTSCGRTDGNKNGDSGKTEENGGGKETGKNEDSRGQDVFDGADLAGRVMEFTEGGFTITPLISENVDGGSLAAEDAPGHEDESKFIHVAYAKEVSFQIVVFDMGEQKEISRMDTDRDSIKKQTEVAIFGTKQDEKNWTADKVFIIRWQ